MGIFKFCQCIALAFVDMVKFCFDVLLVVASLEAVVALGLIKGLDISFDVKFADLKLALEVNGFGYLISWIIEIIGAVLDNFSVAMSVGTRSICTLSLLFYSASI